MDLAQFYRESRDCATTLNHSSVAVVGPRLLGISGVSRADKRRRRLTEGR